MYGGHPFGAAPFAAEIPTAAGTQEITGAGAIGTGEAFGTAVVDRPHVDPSGIASAEAFGTLSLAQHIDSSGIASAQAFGTASIDQTVNPSGIATAEALGTPVVDRPHVDPSGIASLETFGTTSVAIILSIADAGGIASAQAFGTAVVDRPHVDPPSIGSAETFGVPTVGAAGQELVGVGAIASAEIFGGPTLEGTPVIVSGVLGTPTPAGALNAHPGAGAGALNTGRGGSRSLMR